MINKQVLIYLYDCPYCRLLFDTILYFHEYEKCQNLYGIPFICLSFNNLVSSANILFEILKMSVISKAKHTVILSVCGGLFRYNLVELFYQFKSCAVHLTKTF